MALTQIFASQNFFYAGNVICHCGATRKDDKMEKISLRDPQSFIQKILIGFGFVYVSATIGLFVIYWLTKLFVLNRSFTVSSFFGAFTYIVCSSLPSIIFYFLVGLTIPYIIPKSPFRWSVFIGSLMVVSTILRTRTSWAIEPEFVELLAYWVPKCIILPSCVLGTLFFSRLPLLRRNPKQNLPATADNKG